MKLVENFSSSALRAATPLKMVERIASPSYMSKLIGLTIIASPKVKSLAVLIIGNLIKLKLPTEMFEESIIMLQEQIPALKNLIDA